MKMKRTGQVVISVAMAALFFVVGILTPPRYQAVVTFFVPLTLLEKQIEQNGIGFGSPAEVDAHIELMRSEAMEQFIASAVPDVSVDYSVSRTRNGAVELVVESRVDSILTPLAQAIVHYADSLKLRMLRGNIQQSFEFVQYQCEQMEEQVDVIQHELDALRMDASTDSIQLQTRRFRLEKRYGAAVEELTQRTIQRDRMLQMLHAPVPQAYFIDGNAVQLDQTSWSPLLLALLGGGTTFLGIGVFASRNRWSSTGTS